MIKEAWLIFRDGNHKLQPILKEGFGHISVLCRGDEKWMLVTPKENIMKIILLPYHNDLDAPGWLAANKDFTIVRVLYETEIKKCWFPRFMTGFTCVSFVKYFIGYKDYSVTPYKLYKNLLKVDRNILEAEKLECQTTEIKGKVPKSKKSNN